MALVKFPCFILFIYLLQAVCHARGVSSQVSGSVSSTGLWPLPKSYTSTSVQYPVDADKFQFKSVSSDCDILQTAYIRYFKFIFGQSLSRSSFVPDGSLHKSNSIGVLSVNVSQNCASSYPSLTANESYSLSVSSAGATLTAQQVWGALKGLETFSQLVYKTHSGQYVINGTSIMDSPRFNHRGIMLDTSRHYLRKYVIKQNLEAMAMNKFNVFHWHIVDSQSFPYVSKPFPEMSNKGAYDPVTHIYTPEDVQDIIEFARLRGIRVMVEFDSPGHTQSWGMGNPEVLTKCCRGGKFNGKLGPINPIANYTYDFLQNFFGEVASSFPDHYLFLGGDEVHYGCWESNPNITAFMKKQGFGTNYAKLEQYYMQKLLDIISGLKKGYMVWQEVVDNGCKLKPDTVVSVWKFGYKNELAKITKLGYKALLAHPWYLNHFSYGADWSSYYQHDPQDFTGTQEQKDLVMGGEACMWGEFVDDTNLIPRLWPRASAVGERLWSPMAETSDYKMAAPRLQMHRCRMVKRGIPAEEQLGPGYCDVEY